MSTGRGAERAFLWMVAAVAAASGGTVAARGHRAILGSQSPTDPTTDSVLRFNSLVWAAQAPVLARMASRSTIRDREVDAVVALLAVGGLARATAWRQTGRPSRFFQALTVLEFTPPLLLMALRRQRRRSG